MSEIPSDVPEDPAHEVLMMEMRFPWVQWREPINVRLPGRYEGHLGCRLCIAAKGLQAAAPQGKVFSDTEAFNAHLQEVHHVVRK